MENKKEEILLELENVLNTKEFSSDVKTEIKNILLTILEMNIDNKKIHIESIIDSLKKIDTIEFDLRDKLIRKEEISLDLNSNMTGYVKANSNLMVVVKEFQKCANFYHELVHITQNENSYNINPLHYSFPGIFQIAMKEGEAIYYQHKYQQHHRLFHVQSSKENLKGILFRQVRYQLKRDGYSRINQIYPHHNQL